MADPENTLNSLDDDILVSRCQRELPYRLEAFHELLRRHEPLVFNTCLKMIGTHQDAEEACQDAFLLVYHKIGQFEGRSAFKTWLFRIVYNICLRRRETRVRRATKEQEAAEEAVMAIQQREQDAETVEELSAAVREAIARLEPEQREVIVLKFITGLTLNEIAEVLDLKLSATKMRLYRALEKFREAYLLVEGKENPTNNPRVGRTRRRK